MGFNIRGLITRYMDPSGSLRLGPGCVTSTLGAVVDDPCKFLLIRNLGFRVQGLGFRGLLS